MKKNLWLFMLMTALLFTASCSNSDDASEDSLSPTPPPTPVVVKGDSVQIMVVFTPGQLGDNGYADDVIQGLYHTQFIEDTAEVSVVDVDFIALYDMEDTWQAMRTWASSAANPFYEETYKRRLLVLPEPYMISWLQEVKGLLQPTDEVLLMKVNEEDVKEAAAEYGLEGRIYGLNISVTEHVKRYCEYVRNKITERVSFDPALMPSVYYFRLFNEENYLCRDSLSELLYKEVKEPLDESLNKEREEEYDSVKIELASYFIADNPKGAGFSESLQISYLQSAYQYASVYETFFEIPEYDCAFMVVDLGMANSGFDYHLMDRQQAHYEVLMIDADPEATIDRKCIRRKTDVVLGNWLDNWVKKPVGTIPAFSFYDSSYATANF